MREMMLEMMGVGGGLGSFFYNLDVTLEMDAGWKSYNGQELISDWQ